MNYHPDDFLSLVTDVEAEGGTHLSDRCEGVQFDMKNQPADFPKDTGERATRRVSTAACQRSARFLVPVLEPEVARDEAEVNLDPDFVEDKIDFDSALKYDKPATVCAVDDAMGLWPRFEDSMFTGKSFQEF